MIYFILLWSREERNRKKLFLCREKLSHGHVSEVPLQGTLNNPRLQRCLHSSSAEKIKPLHQNALQGGFNSINQLFCPLFLKGDPGQPGDTGLMVSSYLSNGFAAVTGLEKFNVIDWVPQSLWLESCCMLP